MTWCTLHSDAVRIGHADGAQPEAGRAKVVPLLVHAQHIGTQEPRRVWHLASSADIVSGAPPGDMLKFSSLAAEPSPAMSHKA